LTRAIFSKFACFIEFLSSISFLSFSSFMLFWKRMYSSYETQLSRKQWIFLKLFLLILSLLSSSIMRLMWSYLRWTRILKIEKRSWWFCAMKKKHSMRYKSEIWSNVEKKYDVIKKECREILKMLKKIRFYFYDVKIILKTNVRVLVDQLNWFDINLFDAFVIRWLVWIRFFDFEIRHVFDIKHIATNDLSKKSLFSNNLKKIAEKKNIDDWINAQLNCVRVFFVSVRLTVE
jgi:hypothetical protein